MKRELVIGEATMVMSPFSSSSTQTEETPLKPLPVSQGVKSEPARTHGASVPLAPLPPPKSSVPDRVITVLMV